MNEDFLERITGIEPAYSAWEADILPLNHIRVLPIINPKLLKINTENGLQIKLPQPV